MFVSQRLVCFLVLYVSMGVPSQAEYDWCAVYTYQHTCVNFFGTLFHKQRLERGGSAVNVCGRKSSSIFRTSNATVTEEIYGINLRTPAWHQAIGQTHLVGPIEFRSREAGHATFVRKYLSVRFCP
jgi:hypothetical protein